MARTTTTRRRPSPALRRRDGRAQPRATFRQVFETIAMVIATLAIVAVLAISIGDRMGYALPQLAPAAPTVQAINPALPTAAVPRQAAPAAAPAPIDAAPAAEQPAAPAAAPALAVPTVAPAPDMIAASTPAAAPQYQYDPAKPNGTELDGSNGWSGGGGSGWTIPAPQAAAETAPTAQPTQAPQPTAAGWGGGGGSGWTIPPASADSNNGWSAP